MQKQFDLLNEICSMFFSAPEKFDSLEYEYKFNPEEDWVGTKLGTLFQGKVVYLTLAEQDEDRIANLCQQLHDEMQNHTGGDWRKFILTLNEKGEAKTQFIYDIQSCMDDILKDEIS